MISKLVLAEHKVAAALISAVIVAGLGFGIWSVNSILPYPADAIPAPHIGHFTMCSIPMWLQTQNRSVRWLGDCMGQLYSPPPEMKLDRGTTFAIGCRLEGCPLRGFLYSTAPKVVMAQGKHNDAYYFKVVGVGTATIQAIFPSNPNCELSSDGTQPDSCPAIKVVVPASS